jgi:hypothetical protein
MWEPQPLARASTACTGITLPLPYLAQTIYWPQYRMEVQRFIEICILFFEIANVVITLLTEGQKWCLAGTCKGKLGIEILVYREWPKKLIIFLHYQHINLK